MNHIVLASTSPRRKELLHKLNIPFFIYSPNVDETIVGTHSPDTVVQTLALRKAKAVAKQYPHSIVIGADTIVYAERILGKPLNRQEAISMLKELSGRTHSVYTGVAIVHQGTEETFFEKTDVEFWELSNADIERYVDSGEPFDKAGAYGIQGFGAILVKAIIGDYYSVVGLPISRLSRILADKGGCIPPK